jgi:UrcA family protein
MRTAIFSQLACASCLLLAAEFHPAVARAEAPLVTRTIKVDISDLDLTRPHDARTLRHRIAKAARMACGPETTPQEDPPGFHGYRMCYNEAVQNATAQANRTLVASKDSAARER